MYESVSSGKDLHKCPKVSNLSYFPQIEATNLCLSCKLFDHLHRLLTTGKVGAHNGNLSIVFNIYFGVGFGNYIADYLAARAYDVTDFVRVYFDANNSWGER